MPRVVTVALLSVGGCWLMHLRVENSWWVFMPPRLN